MRGPKVILMAILSLVGMALCNVFPKWCDDHILPKLDKMFDELEDK